MTVTKPIEHDALTDLLFRHSFVLATVLGHRDETTLIHSERVSLLADELGRACGLARPDLGILRIGAALHDVGKIGVPDAILAKPGKLDDEEWTAMRRHAEIGEEIVRAIGVDGACEAAGIVRHHHERWDGAGYPDGLRGEAIPLCSRIISISDSYDAMAITRPYQQPRRHEEIVEVMRSESGTKFDPTLLDSFFDLLGHAGPQLVG